MGKDRQIVLMLLRRVRQLERDLNALEGSGYPPDVMTILKSRLLAKYIEAHNAAEYARRILYGTDL